LGIIFNASFLAFNILMSPFSIRRPFPHDFFYKSICTGRHTASAFVAAIYCG